MNNKYGEGLYALNGSSPRTVFFKPYQKYKITAQQGKYLLPSKILPSATQ